MRIIDELSEQLEPALAAVEKDLNINPGYVTMKKLVDKIVAEFDGNYEHATLCVMSMEITVAESEDTEKAAEFLFRGYKLLRKTVISLCSVPNEAAIVQGCRGLSVNC
jgi:hypothetical protein